MDMNLTVQHPYDTTQFDRNQLQLHSYTNNLIILSLSRHFRKQDLHIAPSVRVPLFRPLCSHVATATPTLYDSATTQCLPSPMQPSDKSHRTPRLGAAS